ncbi:TIGR02996 domain-containing protein [Telmatocola sphagniphila]|uniref:TIGR02996 domain-containing protein n=1 Tax=Telmatocola sphagniphila TaxID=1123043 RepID=A0A8E6ETR9_9BACT|nr:TIGR02996 domain-containing protein [Telmatocola sphagniphila]QVL30460.1 TIGR02996 domain-containing protein [Telmatocola sphagniphila]
MTDLQAFLRHIREYPFDATPRLIFADWLEEQGDLSTANFIRGLHSPVAEESESSQLILYHTTQDSSLRFQKISRPGWEIENGFVQAVSFTCYDFLFNVRDLFNSQPITVVKLIDKKPLEQERQFFWSLSFLRFPSPMHDSYLPADIGRFLPRLNGETGNTIGYASLEIAEEALSRACVAHGRNIAGLPPLVWPDFEEIRN